MVKKSAGRSGVALVNTTWCTRVVLPEPGSPAITLNEYSGKPPPRTWSSRGTPLGRVFSRGFGTSLIHGSFRQKVFWDRDTRPGLGDESQCELLAYERGEEPDRIGDDCGESGRCVGAARPGSL